jgi:hypothetical protein
MHNFISLSEEGGRRLDEALVLARPARNLSLPPLVLGSFATKVKARYRRQLYAKQKRTRKTAAARCEAR